MMILINFYMACADIIEALNPAINILTNENPDAFSIGLGSQEQEINQSVLIGGTAESFDSLVKLDDVEPWTFEPTSPDRQSWSSVSASSCEAGSDFTDLADSVMLPTPASSYAGFGMFTDDSTPKLSHSERSQLTDHTESGSSMHDFQRSWSYSSDSLLTNSVSTTCHDFLATQCCSPSEDWHDELTINDLNLPFEHTSALGSDSMFEMADGDLESFHLSSVEATNPRYSYDDLFLSTSPADLQHHNKVTSILPSSSHLDHFHRHTSTADACDSHSVDGADAPDLFGPLEDDQLSPNSQDMNPEDADLTPRKQELRFEGDLYTPRYVRGHGNKREGWCGICKPGRWLVLKNSAFWYDKSFSHGISAASGIGFDGPKKTRRMSGNPEVWEGLCASCGDWIALISSKKKGTTWFRHAYKVSLIYAHQSELY